MQTVHLVSDSTGYDGALVSLSDAAKVCTAAHLRKWLVVGGHMVNLHILRSGLALPLRLTHDCDIAVEIRMIRRGTLLEKLRELGYRNRVYPNRFDREVDGLAASIDLVVASYSTKHEPNIDADEIVVDGMPAVDEALDRDPVVLHLIGDRTDGVRMEMTVHIPDVMGAIAMKSFAIAERPYPNDAIDLARLLLVCAADGVTRWPRGKAYRVAAVQLAAQFDTPGSALELATEDPALRSRLREITRSLAHN
ncbi:MAG TPA: hypothetical protein VH561_13630 [Micromonosporaceae bacterium]|jgi:hypothetical protein